jgi:hypothetical protein
VKRIVTFVFFATLMLRCRCRLVRRRSVSRRVRRWGHPYRDLFPPGAEYVPRSWQSVPGLLIVSGYYGATINYSIPGTNGSVTIDFFGGEAGFSDQFLYDSGAGYVMPPGFDHPGVPTVALAPNLASPLATFTAPLSGSGVLPFEFRVNGLIGGGDRWPD